MELMSRRELLASVGAVALLPPKAGFAFTPPLPLSKPTAEATGFAEIIHGKRIADPYRWMENKTDPRWQPFITDQAAYARSFLDSIPERSAFLKRVSELASGPIPSEVVQAAGGRLFTFARSGGRESLSLWVRDSPEGPDRLLVDPADLAPSGSIGGIDYYWSVSPNGRYLVFGFFLNGAEDVVLRIVDSETGKLLPDRIEQANMSARYWANDSSGFFYSLLSGGDGTEKYKKSRTLFHRLGTEPVGDKPIFGSGLQEGLQIADAEFPEVVCDPSSRFLIGYLGRIGNQVGDVYVTSLPDALRGTHVWRRVATAEDEIRQATPYGEEIYFISVRKAQGGRILKFAAATSDVNGAIEIPTASGDIILGIAPARNGIYIASTRSGAHKLTRLGSDGQLRTVELPFEGAMPFGLNSRGDEDGLWIVPQSWVVPPTICRVGTDDKAVPIGRRNTVGQDRYTSEVVMIPARDGTKVPLSIIYDRSSGRNGSAPMIMVAYGAYGTTLDPRYTPTDIAWLERGGVLAVAHVRGGGELGEPWHKAGFKRTKPNSWRDLIDCGRWLVKNGYTSPSRLAIQGKSAGGLTAGRAMTEAPEEFAAVILRVAAVNPMRKHVTPGGPANAEEFGSIEDPVEAGWLLEMDSYQHVVPGIRYPPVLLTTGLEDPRVPPWQPAKMAAKLQSVSCGATLLRIESKGGHGLGSTRRQEIEEKTDIFSFAWWAAHSPKVACS